MMLHSRYPLALLAPTLIINVAHLVGANAAELNYEVEGRIIGRLTFYMQDHVTTNLLIPNFTFQGDSRIPSMMLTGMPMWGSTTPCLCQIYITASNMGAYPGDNHIVVCCYLILVGLFFAGCIFYVPFMHS